MTPKGNRESEARRKVNSQGNWCGQREGFLIVGLWLKEEDVDQVIGKGHPDGWNSMHKGPVAGPVAEGSTARLSIGRRSVCLERSQHRGLKEETEAWPYRNQWARWGLLFFILRTMRSFTNVLEG